MTAPISRDYNIFFRSQPKTPLGGKSVIFITVWFPLAIYCLTLPDTPPIARATRVTLATVFPVEAVKLLADQRKPAVNLIADYSLSGVGGTQVLRQTGALATRKAPMGFGFAADGAHAFVCCHDDAVVMEFALSTGRATREFPTASGCEFVIAYQ